MIPEFLFNPIEAQTISGREKIVSILKTAPDVVVPLAGGVVTDTDGGTRSPGYGEMDFNKLVSGAYWRVIAAFMVTNAFADVIVEANSVYDTDRPHPVDVMTKELEEMGLDTKRIVREARSKSTFGNIAQLVRLSGCDGQWRDIAVITNEYHVPRTEMIINLITHPPSKYLQDAENDEFFQRGLASIRDIRVVSCEDILIACDPQFEEYFREVKETQMYKDRVKAEEHGILQLKDFTYKRGL